MKKVFILATALFLSIGLISEALAACTPIPPKSWAGGLEIVIPPGAARASEQFFLHNDCSFSDHPELNGLDAQVWNVRGYAGLPASVTLATGTTLFGAGVTGYFLTGGCTRISGSTWSGSALQPARITIPNGAAWAMTYGIPGLVPSNDLTLKMKSPGRTCPKKLTASASPQTFRGSRAVKFTVKAGGRAVRGAMVSIAGKKRTTNSAGVAKIDLGPYSRVKHLRAKVTKRGYRSATVTVTAKPG